VDVVAFAAGDKGVAAVAGVEQAEQFAVEGKVSFNFVQQHDGLAFVDDAVDNGRPEILDAERSGDHGGDDFDGGAFAAGSPASMTEQVSLASASTQSRWRPSLS
jgi:hypothetical protein